MRRFGCLVGLLNKRYAQVQLGFAKVAMLQQKVHTGSVGLKKVTVLTKICARSVGLKTNLMGWTTDNDKVNKIYLNG